MKIKDLFFSQYAENHHTIDNNIESTLLSNPCFGVLHYEDEECVRLLLLFF